ncbi:hypothetical protein BX666DRAFT_1994829 [Dichotomocladium elegans]|nr:hypothetical protein BX666DRAFT_1994829 [Dichotomocladium elegans]
MVSEESFQVAILIITLHSFTPVLSSDIISAVTRWIPENVTSCEINIKSTAVRSNGRGQCLSKNTTIKNIHHFPKSTPYPASPEVAGLQ